MLLSNEDKTNYVPWGWQEYILLIFTGFIILITLDSSRPLDIGLYALFLIGISVWLSDRIKAPYHVRRRLMWGSALFGILFMIIYYLYVFSKIRKKM